MLRPGPWLAPRVLGWLVFVEAVLVALALSPQLLGAALHRDIPSTPALATGLLLASGGAYALMVRLGERRAPRELALTTAPVELTCGAAIGFGLMCTTLALLLATGLYKVRTGHPGDWSLAILYNLAIAFREELMFRAVILRLLARIGGAPAALALSALLFGLAHFLSPHATLLAAAAIAVEAGLMLGACLLLTGRLWLAVGVHAAWNFTEGAVLGASLSGHDLDHSLLVSRPAPGAPPLWSGGGFGPEASPIATLVCLCAFAALVALIVRHTSRRRSVGDGARAPLHGGAAPAYTPAPQQAPNP